MQVGLVLLLSLLVSCSTIQEGQKLKADKFYKRDMVATVNGITYVGTGVFPVAPKYDFHVEASGNLDRFEMSTCHKEETKEKAWNVKKRVKSGLFGWGRKNISLRKEVKFTHYPMQIERNKNCPIRLAAQEELRGRHSWFLGVFESPKYKLPAKIQCNGRLIESNGTSICQSKNGLFQIIQFDEPVIAANNNKCGVHSEPTKKYEIELPLGLCLVTFASIKKPHKFHILTLLGNESTLIRR